MRKLFHFAVAASLFVACGGEHQPSVEEQHTIDSTTLKVAVMPTLDCLPFYVAEAHGMLQTDSLHVALVHYTAQMDCDTAIARERVECMVTDLVRAERLQQQGTPLSYLSATGLSWQLLTSYQARIRQLKQLDDKMLAMTRYSATALLADQAVDSAGLKAERVFRIQVNDVGIRLSMLENNIMDALLLPEPQATQARNLRARVLTDSRRQDVWLGVIAASAKAQKTDGRREQMARLMAVYDRACDSINTYGLAAYRDLICQRCGVKAATVDSLPTDLHFSHAAPPRQQDIDRAKAWLNKP